MTKTVMNPRKRCYPRGNEVLCKKNAIFANNRNKKDFMSKTIEFNQATIEALAYYVYALVDPRNNRIFYIGKGKGNRVFQHAKDSLNESDQSLKLDIIRNILKEGKQVSLYIIRHNLTEETAYIVESTLIDLLTYSKFSNTILLANIAAGHHQWDEGIKDVDEINTIYNCPKINIKPGETLLLVSLNNSFNQAKVNGVYRRIDIYEATRKFWKISKNSPYEIKYVLGIYKGVVRSVIEVKSWKWATVADDGTIFKSERCIFEGKLLENSPYINNVSSMNSK